MFLLTVTPNGIIYRQLIKLWQMIVMNNLGSLPLVDIIYNYPKY